MPKMLLKCQYEIRYITLFSIHTIKRDNILNNNITHCCLESPRKIVIYELKIEIIL